LALLGALALVGCGERAAPPAPLRYQRLEPVLRLAERLDDARIEAARTQVREKETAIGGVTMRSIFEHPNATIVFPSIPIPQRAHLEFAVGIEDAGWPNGSDGVHFTLQIGHDGQRETLFDHLIDPSEKDRGWIRQQIDLARFAGRSVDLVLVTDGGPSGNRYGDWANWGDPLIRGDEVAAPDQHLPNILLVSFDTLRADFVGSYGYPLQTSPRLDALARRGALFERAVAAAPWTLPSHFAMLSGLRPHRRMLRYDEQPCPIDNDVVMLAERLEAHGYLTAAFTGGGYITPWLGFAQGFDYFESRGRRLEDNLPAIQSWLGEHGRTRFFLFVHHYNLHRPFEPPRPFRVQFAPDVPKECEGVTFSPEDQDAGRAPKCLEAPGGLAYLRGVYAAELANADALFGQILDQLDRQGVLDDTLVIAVSDHGEELMDHGELDHVRTLHGEVVNVPLILAGPGIPAGIRIPEAVETANLTPTVLDLIGVHEPWRERSLAPLLACRRARATGLGCAPMRAARALREALRPGDETAFSATALDRGLKSIPPDRFDFKAAAVRGGRKLIVSGEGPDRLEELYDLREDPLEQHPAVGGGKAPDLDRQLDAWIQAMPPDRVCPPSVLYLDSRKQLEALGYLR
jgi:arylsulfatase A-like enzyme